jgi:hypothetical protein
VYPSSSESTELAHGTINGADEISVQLFRPTGMPAVVRIVWPAKPTVCHPRRYTEVAAAAMKLLAEASTTLAGIKASRRL